MATKKQVFKQDYDVMTNKIRRQMGVINRSRMHSRKGNGVASQPFYVLFMSPLENVAFV